MIFSHRTGWQRRPNRLADLLASRRASGKPVYDLTLSNPTACGIRYPARKIVESLAERRSLRYDPDPRGLSTAREAIVSYYLGRGIKIDSSSIFLSASTSESYSLALRLLCDAGENVLAPQPSYPLFDYLGKINDVEILPYRIRNDGGWRIDADSIRSAITPGTKAIIVVNPHNPCGMFLSEEEALMIGEITAKHSLALIVDEVFIDYPIGSAGPSSLDLTEAAPLTITLNGISKMIGMPQLKLGWMVVTGAPEEAGEAAARLEIMCDTFLSPNTPVQAALPELLERCKPVRSQILRRIASNYRSLERLLRGTPCSVLPAEGGWYAIIRVPRTRTDEEWALDLLREEGVYVYPGYFFDFEEDGFLVVSLLPEPELFATAVRKLVKTVRRQDL